MTRYDLDKVVDRRNTNSLKYDFAVERGYPADVLPMWLADMDFQAPPPVLEALHRAVDHGIFGYSEVKSAYYRTVAGWFRRRFGWETQEPWLVKTPGIVFALVMAVRALTAAGDDVAIMTPVYRPFYNVVRSNGRTLLESALRYQDGRYTVDWEDFEEKAARAKLFILCSPHNPVGRVWTREELEQMGRICGEHGTYVVSDEIHCDFAFPEHPHTPFPMAAPDLSERTVVCTAPSKTFNLAGLQVSNIWIPGEDTRRRFCQEIDRSGYEELNALGLVACEAAYRDGEEWLDQCRSYMRANLDFLRTFLAEKLPQIRLVEPEGGYFAWLDCSGLGLDDDALEDLIVQKARLWLDNGSIFGKAAGQFQRMVLACPRATLLQALDRLERAVDGILELDKNL